MPPEYLFTIDIVAVVAEDPIWILVSTGLGNTQVNNGDNKKLLSGALGSMRVAMRYSLSIDHPESLRKMAWRVRFSLSCSGRLAFGYFGGVFL
jgi:hypothetical protein